MITGIYQIQNKINKKIYIGQSIDIKKRWREHKFASLHKEYKDHLNPIHLAISKYGIDNFIFSIVEECPKEKLNEREIYWIEKKNSYNKGYNATIGGNEDHRHLGCPIELYDLQGNYITEYENITIAAENIGVSRNTVYQILQGERLSCKGFQFKRKMENKIIGKYKNKQGGKIPVIQIDKNTQKIINNYESATEAARQLHIDASTITKVCKGKLKTCGGFIWKYAN